MAPTEPDRADGEDDGADHDRDRAAHHQAVRIVTRCRVSDVVLLAPPEQDDACTDENCPDVLCLHLWVLLHE